MEVHHMELEKGPIIKSYKRHTLSRNLFIILLPTAACTILYFVEQSGSTGYLIKTLIKILLFIPIPLLYKTVFADTWQILKRSIKPLRGIVFGIVFFAVLLSAYYILARNIDLGVISQNLGKNMKVTASNFIFVAIYITFGNSFLEEYFFRGFIFLKLKENGHKFLGYTFSSVLFSLYHIMIFQKWFTTPMFILAVAGLAGVGLLFDFMDSKPHTIYNSWISHILADSAIMLIGLRMFNLL
jgi:membrane protease YdiL (CAAX protease family)